jgi:hypothetical protein
MVNPECLVEIASPRLDGATEPVTPAAIASPSVMVSSPSPVVNAPIDSPPPRFDFLPTHSLPL